VRCGSVNPARPEGSNGKRAAAGAAGQLGPHQISSSGGRGHGCPVRRRRGGGRPGWERGCTRCSRGSGVPRGSRTSSASSTSRGRSGTPSRPRDSPTPTSLPGSAAPARRPWRDPREVLNCETGPTASPCNVCASCVEITEGRSMDVMELDAASRTGVDDIRELQEVVSFAPVRDRYRILILDEAHMLSKSAVNALLKTLEEPPARVTFVLATTEIHKILRRFSPAARCSSSGGSPPGGRRAPPESVRCRGHPGVGRDARQDRALRRRLGPGLALRSGASARVLRRRGGRRGRTAGSWLGQNGVLVDLVRALAARDAASMLGVLDGVIGEGHDLVHFWNEAVSAIRDILLLRTLPAGRTFSRVPSRRPWRSSAPRPSCRGRISRARSRSSPTSSPPSRDRASRGSCSRRR